MNDLRLLYFPEDLGGGGDAGDGAGAGAGDAGGGEGTPFAFFSQDGNLNENWKEGLSEDLRGEETLNTFKDFPGAIKMLVHAQKQIGKDHITAPGEHSPQEDWDAFYKAGGRPETAGDYQIEIGDDIKEHVPDNRVLAARDVFHKLGMNQAQVAGVMDLYKGFISEDLQSLASETQTTVSEAEALIDKMQGAAKPQRVHLANQFIDQNVRPEYKDQVVAEINKSNLKPFILDMFASSQAKMVEHQISPPPPGGSGMTPAQANEEMQKLQATPGYLTGELKKQNPAAYDDITRQCTELAKLAAS
jgi:hypothetical protein